MWILLIVVQTIILTLLLHPPLALPSINALLMFQTCQRAQLLTASNPSLNYLSSGKIYQQVFRNPLWCPLTHFFTSPLHSRMRDSEIAPPGRPIQALYVALCSMSHALFSSISINLNQSQFNLYQFLLSCPKLCNDAIWKGNREFKIAIWIFCFFTNSCLHL